MGTNWQNGFLFLLLVLACGCTDNEVSTGETYEFVGLPDGSEVYLNWNSRIAYDSDFEDRLVNLDGEAFFVVEEAETPFMVRTSFGDVVVLGTEFSVSTNDESLEVEVAEGVVNLDTEKVKQDIKRGQRALIRFGEDVAEVGKAEFKFKKWMKEMEKEFKRLGRDVKKEAKEFGKESKKAAKALKKELKNLDD